MNNNNNYSDDDEGDGGEAFPSGMVTSSPRRQRHTLTTVPTTTSNDYGDEDSNDPMQPPLSVHVDEDDKDNEDKQGGSWYSYLNCFNYSYVCGHRRWLHLTAACALSSAALTIGLVLLILSIQAGQQRDANNEAAASAGAYSNSNSNDSILPSRPLKETAVLQQEFWALYNLVRMRDTTGGGDGGDGGDNVDMDTKDDDRYAHFVLSGSPQWRAVEWLLSEDLAQLPFIKNRVPDVARLRQRYALAVLYFHFGGAAWNLPAGTGWLSDTNNDVAMNECDWLAVVCSDDDNGNTGLVTALELGPEIPMRMAGVLPSELGLLTALNVLDLADKGITGTIPAAVYRSLTNLRYLDIGNNRLVSLSPAIAHWSNLQTLIVANNKLYGALPTELYSLTNLQVLFVQNNPLASGRLLESIGSWPVMELLDVSITNISGTLSPDVGELTNLQLLGAAFLPLSGSLPDEISNCRALKELSIGYVLSDGLLGTIPKSLGLLTNLEGLAFPQAGFSGTLPSELGALTKLLFLDLAGINALTGSIPSEIGLLTDLVFFKAFSTALTGTLPTELGRATNLVSVQVQSTDLTGSIPASLCAMFTAGTLKELAAQCQSDNSTGIPEPAQVECDCRCMCYL
jgi:hypothetical protein